jgi:hypothetical protein
MANRRMVSLKIVDSARFLKMPTSSQNLYYHLVTRADDDGIVEAYNVIRITGSSEDDLKILVAKGFVRVLNEDLVSYITDWTEHNLIRADRKIDSIYKNLLLQIIEADDEPEEEKPAADNSRANDSELRADDGQVSGKCQHRLGYVRLGKVRLGQDNTPPPTKPAAKTCDASAPPLYQAIWQSFLAKTPKFTNYPKEAQATKRLCQLFQDLAPDKPEQEAEVTLRQFWTLTQQGAPFWRKQPFTPATLSSPGIFDRVRAELTAADYTADWVDKVLAYDG